MAEMLLFGAGASFKANVPVATKMTREICDRIRQSPSYQREAQVLSFVIGGLLFQQGQEGGNPLDGNLNVEELFNAVQLLGGRHDLEAAPFVGSWHHMVEQLDRKVGRRIGNANAVSRAVLKAVAHQVSQAVPLSVPAFADTDVDEALREALRNSGHGSYFSGFNSVGRQVGDLVKGYLRSWTDNLRNRSSADGGIDRELQRAIESQREQPGDGQIYAHTASVMISMLRELVWIDSISRVEYLSPILNLLRNQGRLAIATLNYDNAVELLAETQGVGCTTGIESWTQNQRLECPNEGLILLKLHGSIDWMFAEEDASPERPLPVRTIRRVPASAVLKNDHPAVIFGQRNKLTAEGPFLDLLRQFKAEMDKADLITVVGYSFADAHVNEYIARWLNASPGNRLRIVDPGFPRNENAFAELLRDKCVHRIEVYAEGAEVALPKIYPVGQTTMPFGS